VTVASTKKKGKNIVARILFSTIHFALRQRRLCEKLRRNITGKELDPETGLYYYGARYLDPKTGRWLSGDPALGEYVPSAPVNEEARKRNGNLPGMGGVFNYVNLHVYHYAGNNPVKYVDPDGRYSGLIRTAKTFVGVFTRALERVPISMRSDLTFNEVLNDVTISNESAARTTITTDSRNAAINKFGIRNREEQQNYINSEITRYEAFARIRGRDEVSYLISARVLATAESRYRDAENEANKIIDDYICNNDPTYVPPEPLRYVRPESSQ
jgi:RHS repeat-associated protein